MSQLSLLADKVRDNVLKLPQLIEDFKKSLDPELVAKMKWESELKLDTDSDNSTGWVYAYIKVASLRIGRSPGVHVLAYEPLQGELRFYEFKDSLENIFKEYGKK